MRFFFYGSLLDPDIRRIVMGKGGPWPTEPATLAGWRRRRRHDAIYPILERRAGAAVEGVVVSGVTPAAAARLAAFEGSNYGIALLRPRAADGRLLPAFLFLPRRRLAGPAPWDETGWAHGRKAAALRSAAREMMAGGRTAVRLGTRIWHRHARLWQNRRRSQGGGLP
jgi:hypothetical protein